ncbi:2'-5' RNA ligase superfamily protein [Paractinoplanes atraurantiacus]|uniref:2'-5' RNA ligase superfamily protein n=2 Tax=Paractinoplanes atraurantiacus TaxID=1036182 RepID=A0A285K0D3_9ACTN|nr:2'-5' RNA ligase superfamily protein [Actinoplanes atraurantiacus]
MWFRLKQAGLPSLATHGHASNRPHLTVATAASLAGLSGVELPLRAELGAVRSLGRAVVWEVRPTAELRELQARVWEALDEAWPPPQEWVPHVSLALRVPAGQHEAVPAALGDLPRAAGFFVAARSYDTATRVVTDLAS